MSATQSLSGSIGGLRGPGGVVTPDLQTLHDGAVAAQAAATEAADDAQGFANQSKAAAQTLNIASRIGMDVGSNPATGTDPGGAITVGFLSPTEAAWQGTTLDVYNLSGSAQTLTLRRFNATTGAQIGSSVNINVPSGPNTGLDISAFSGNAGELLGYYESASLVPYLASGQGARGSYVSGAGNLTTINPAGTVGSRNFQIRINYSYVGVTGADYIATKATVVSNGTDLTYLATAVTRGRGTAPVNGTVAGGGAVFAIAKPMEADGIITDYSAFGGSAAGAHLIKVWTPDGNGKVNQRGSDVSVNVGVGVLATKSGLTIPFKAGDLLGMYVPAGSVELTTGGTIEDGGRYQASGGNVSTFALGPLVTSSQLQAQFKIRLSGAASRIANLESTVKMLGGPIKPLAWVDDGNSFFAGPTVPATNSPPPGRILGTLALLPGTTFFDFSVGGQTTQQMTADAATQVDPVIAAAIAAGYQPVLLLTEIYNDCRVNYNGSSFTLQTAIDNMKAYCNARKTANPGVIIGLENIRDVAANRGAVSGNNFPVGGVTTLNNLLAAQYATFCDFLIDIHANSIFQDCTNTTWYQVDQVHPTVAATAIEARIIRQAVRAYFQSL